VGLQWLPLPLLQRLLRLLLLLLLLLSLLLVELLSAPNPALLFRCEYAPTPSSLETSATHSSPNR
jgi:hypothetical protein